MNKTFNFYNISQYDSYVINLNKKDYGKMQKCIAELNGKYNSKIEKLYQIEKNNTSKFDFSNQRKFIISHKKILINIIKDVLKTYSEELNNLSVVFLSGSFARGTNKMSSDVDLHFFYSNDNYNYIYEEIASYIISRVINKSRDCIDPTFIFNLQSENKVMITNKMDKNKLNVVLKYRSRKIKYSYKYGKKRRFYLQYTNTRDIIKLFHYLNDEIVSHNYEWCHCLEIIKGKNIFNKMYDTLYINELKLIDKNYINIKIRKLREKIEKSEINVMDNSISQYKKNYQSKIFEWIYEYVSIIRLILIKEGYQIKFLNLLSIYDIQDNKSIVNNHIFIQIYQYMWSLEKLTVYCHDHGINYGLHNTDIINYSTQELDENLNKLKYLILNDLKRLGELYE